MMTETRNIIQFFFKRFHLKKANCQDIIQRSKEFILVVNIQHELFISLSLEKKRSKRLVQLA